MNRHEAFSKMKSQIPGFSAEGVMGLLNEYVSAIPADRFYCEVGSFHGLTLVAALHGNGTRAISIDNFSEFGGKESDLQDSIARFALGERVRLLSHDFREAFSRGMIERSSIAVYFYDGAHDYTSQVEGLKLSEIYLADGALAVVDDTNWEASRRATLEWVEQRGSELLESKPVPDPAVCADPSFPHVVRDPTSHRTTPAISAHTDDASRPTEQFRTLRRSGG